jgi:dihydroorotase-like cyclic amidohydrolase
VFDPTQEWTLTDDMLYSKCGWSVHVGAHALGKATHTYLRGELVQQNGTITGIPRGKQIRRGS